MTMEALNFLRLRQPTATTTATTTTTTTTTAMPNDVDEEEDSFIELELTVPPFDRIDSDTLCSHLLKQSNFLNSTPSPSKVESFSKRKVLPIEYSVRHQSPVSHLKSAPKFGASMFRKSKSVSSGKTEQMNGNRGVSPEYSLSGESNSKRFTKDVIQKYMKLVAPLYDRVSKKPSDKVKLVGELPVRKVKPPRIQLGKSKSTSASAAAFQSPARRDDSLVQQNDGIESAILHCKQSFNSCRDLCRGRPDKPSDSSRSSEEQTSHASMS